MSEVEDMPIDVTPPAKRRIGYVFVGKDGLRAGWSLLLFVLLLGAIGFAIVKLHPPTKPPAAGITASFTLIGESLAFFSVALAAFIVSLVERRPFSRYGLRGARALPDALTGAVWGLVMLSLLVAVLTAIGAIKFDGLMLHGVQMLSFGGEWLLAFLFVGLFEEFLFRGFLQYTLARGVAGIIGAISPGNPRARTIGFWVSAFVFSVVLFAFAHVSNGGETALGIFQVSLAGLVFVYSLYRTGSLWWVIGFHTTWDWAQSFLYGVADSGQVSVGRLLATHPVGGVLVSGGSAGPEGSVLAVPVVLLTIVVIHTTLPKRATAFDA
jgi:uncharacterized protein